MKYLIMLLCFSLTFMSVEAKTTVKVKLKSGKTVSGYMKKAMTLRPDRIILNDENSGDKITVMKEDIESMMVTNKKGETYKFKTFEGSDNYFNSKNPTVYEQIGQVIVSSENAELYLLYDYVPQAGTNQDKKIQQYYLYLPQMGYAVKVHSAGELNLGKSFTNKLVELLGDDNSIRSKIENKEYKRKELDQLIVDYNKNAGFESKVYEESIYRF